MLTRKLLAAFLPVTLTLLGEQAAAPTTPAVSRPPNIVLILVDDFGYECVTANGGESYRTPVMDQLAATGVRFEQCHAQPLCTPTRVQLMTGLSNRRNYTHFGHLDPKQTTFANLLQRAGYATCIAGKWQLDNGYEGPGRFGFDEYCLWQLNRKVGRYKNPGLEINGRQLDYTHNEYGPDLVSDYALDFITRQKDRPFLLYYTMMLTHSPYDATPDTPGYTTARSNVPKGNYRNFGDMVAYTDQLIGKVVARLEALQLRENTVLLVLGDNGTGRGTPSRFQGRDVVGGKGTSTVWGTRVPFIANWPGHFPGGRVCGDLIDTTDFLPTLSALTAITIPADLPLDGRSFLPQLLGERGTPREWLYAWYNPSGGATAKVEFAHDARYKLYADGRFYSVTNDEKEKSPLDSDQLTADARTARARLQAALDHYSGPRPDYFVKQYQQFGGEAGEDADGNVTADPAPKKKRKAKQP